MRKEYRLLYLLAILKFILPFLIQDPAYEPHRDEFLYLAEGRHMAWGYMEVPPVLSVFAWLTNAFGGGFFWIKCWPSLFGAATYLLVGRLILSLGGKGFALVLGVTPFLAGAWLRMFFLFQPNCPEIFFWTLTAYGFIRYAQTNGSRYVQTDGPRHPQTDGSRYLYIAGLGIGLGMMSKYSMAFFAVSLLMGLLLTKQRKVFLNRHLYFALLVALLIFFPNLLWQYRHGFPVVYHMHELEQSQLQYLSPVNFLLDQLIYFLPCFLIWLAGLGWMLLAPAGSPYRFAGIGYILVIGLLLIGHGKSYYSMGAYPMLFAFGSVCIERWAVGRLYFMRWVLIAIVMSLGAVFVTIALPFRLPRELADFYKKTGIAGKAGALRWEDQQDHPLPQDFSDMLSWKEMTQKMAKGYAQLDSLEKTRTLLFCDNYGEAGAVNYYGPLYGLPAAYSDNASFLYWMPERFDQFDNLLLVTDDRQEMSHAFVHEFKSAVVVDSITNPFAREHGSLIILFKGPSDVFKKAFHDKIEKAKLKTTATGALSTGVKPNALEKGGELH